MWWGQPPEKQENPYGLIHNFEYLGWTRKKINHQNSVYKGVREGLLFNHSVYNYI